MLLLKTFMFAALISCLTQSFFMPLNRTSKVSDSLKSIPKVSDFENSTRTDLILKLVQNEIIENNRIFLNEALDNKFMLLNNNIKELGDISEKNINDLRDIVEKNNNELRGDIRELRDKISPLITIYTAVTLVAGAMLQLLLSKFLGK